MYNLVIYDDEGYLISVVSSIEKPREPVGIPFLWVEIPKGKQIKIVDGIGVDTTVTPHQVILEDIPPTELEIQQEITNTLGKEITDIKL